MKTSLIDSVVTITQQRDISALESCLLDEIINMSTSIDQAILYAVEDEADQLKCNEICYRGSPRNIKHEVGLEDDNLKQLASLDSIIHTLSDGRQCLLVGIKQDHSELLVLEVIARSIDSELEHIVKAFARIYYNFTHLINESEKDNLTGLLNRRTFEVRLKRLLLSQASPDVDLFESSNNRRETKFPSDNNA